MQRHIQDFPKGGAWVWCGHEYFILGHFVAGHIMRCGQNAGGQNVSGQNTSQNCKGGQNMLAILWDGATVAEW